MFLKFEMTSKEQNEQKTKSSTKKPSPEFLETLRRGKVQLMKEQYEKGMKEYHERKKKENQNPKDQK
jgi:hypothetical protein